MDVFNPKILDASIRDVASCLSDTQKVDLLLYALSSIPLPPVSHPQTHPLPHTQAQTQAQTEPSPASSLIASSSTASSTVPPPYTNASSRAPASASASSTASYTQGGYGLFYSHTFNSSSSSSSYSYSYSPYTPAHTLLENGIASILQVRALPARVAAKARVLRARARIRMGGPPRPNVGGCYGSGAGGGGNNNNRAEGGGGGNFGSGGNGGGNGGGECDWVQAVREDLHAALDADPTNNDARALLAVLDGERERESELRPETTQIRRGRESDEQHGGEGDEDDDDGDDRGRDRDRYLDREMDTRDDVAREREMVPMPVQTQATRGPTGAEKILSPMASPTLVHLSKSSSSRPSTSSRPAIPHAFSSYASSSSYVFESTSTSTSSSTMPPPASPTPTPTFNPAFTPAFTPTAPTAPTHAYRTPTCALPPVVHIPPTRLSAEVWRLVGTYLTRRDLANLLYLRHPLARVAAERLAADVEVWFGSGSGGASSPGEWEDGCGDYSDRDADYEDSDVDMDMDRDGEREDIRARRARKRRDHLGDDEEEVEERKDDARRATRTAHLLAKVIRDPVFAARVRTLRVYFSPAVGSGSATSTPSRASPTGRRSNTEHANPGVAFQTGILANALPSLVQLRNVHISGGADAMVLVLRILQRRAPNLTGLSLSSPDSPPDLSFLDLRRLIHFSYTVTGPSGANTPPASSSTLQHVLASAQGTLKSVALLNSYAAAAYLQPQPQQGVGSTNISTAHAYNNAPPTATATSAANTSYAGPIGHQQLLHPQTPPQSNGNNAAGSSTASGTGAGYSRHGQSRQQGQYSQYPLTHPYAPSPHQHALPSHARSLAPHPHSAHAHSAQTHASAHAHSAQTHASAMMSVHALAGGSGGSSHVGPVSSGGTSRMMPQRPQRYQDQPGYRPRLAPAPPAGNTIGGMSGGVHVGGGVPSQPPPPPPPPAPVPLWVFPTGALSIGNLARIHFAGVIPAGSRVFADILAHGRHLETLDIECAPLECTDAAQQFLDAASGGSSNSFRSSSSKESVALPFLINFSFTVSSLSRRYVDNCGGTALFPAIAEFLRGRRTLRTLALVVAPQASASVEAQMHTAVGFDASVWGVLPSLQGALRGVRMTYPADLSAGLAGWLVPRSVRALAIVMGESGPLNSSGADGTWTPGADRDKRSPGGRDWDSRERERDRDDRGDKQRAGREAIQFLNALKSSMPPGLRFVSLPDCLLSILASPDRISSSGVNSSTTAATLVVEHGFPSVRVVRMGASYWTVSRKTHASALGHSNTSGAYSTRDPSAPPSYESHMYDDRNPPSGADSRGEKQVLELEKWPRHRALYHTSEWLAWYGCEDAVIRDVGGFDA